MSTILSIIAIMLMAYYWFGLGKLINEIGGFTKFCFWVIFAFFVFTLFYIAIT